MSKNSQSSASGRVLKTSAIRTVLKSVIICAIIGAIVGLGVMLASNLGLTASSAPETVVARRASSTSETTSTDDTIDLTGIEYNDATFVYDGKVKSVTLSEEDEAALKAAGVTIEYHNNKHTHVGTYTAVVVFYKGGNTKYLTATIEITPGVIDVANVKFESKTFTYDGTAKKVVLTGSIPSDAEVIYINNTATKVGTYTATAVICGENYGIYEFTTTYEIKESGVLSEIVKFADKEFSYDEKEHSIAITGTLPTGVKVTYEGNAQKECGTYTVTATVSGYGYTTYVTTAKITIVPGDLVKVYGIKFDDKTVTYDAGNYNLALTGKLDGVNITYTYNGETTDTVPTFKNAGTYEVSVNLSKASFNDASLTATLVINKARVDGALNYDDTTRTYDGNATGLKVGEHGNYFSDETTVTFTHNGVTQEEPFTFTEAGKYDVTITVKGANIETYTFTKTVTINKALITNVSFYNTDYTYRDGAKRTMKVDIDGELPEGVYVEYSCGGVTDTHPLSYTNAGEYKVTATVKGNDNYEELVLTATLYIEKEDLAYYVDIDRNQKFTNNGSSYLPTYEFYEDIPEEALGSEVKFYMNGELLTEGLSQPGEYDITMVIESENYYFEEEITLTIGYNAIVILIGLVIGAVVGILVGIIVSAIGSSRDQVSQRHFAVPREGVAKMRGGILCESRAKSKNTKRNGRLYLTNQTLEFYAEDYKTAANNFLISLKDIRSVDVMAHNKIIVCANRQYYVFTVPAGRAEEWRSQIERA